MYNIEKYTISTGSSILDAIKKLNELSSEIALILFVVDDDQKVIGSLTDGDIRRALINGYTLNETVETVALKKFTYLRKSEFNVEKLRHIKTNRLKIVPILDNSDRLIRIATFTEGYSYLPIDAVLMAGGKGERLRPATLTVPKPLLKVGEMSIIDYNINNLLRNGVENISVTTNYLGEQIEEHFSKPQANGVQVRCVREPKYLGTMGSIKFVENWYNDSILVMNSDLFTNINLEDFFLHFIEHDADMSIAAVPYSVNIPYGILDIENKRDVTGVKEKPSYHYYANAGIYLIKRKMIDLIPNGEFFNATDLMQKLIEDNKKVIRFPLSGYWIDIGKPEDFKKAQDLVHHIQQ